MSKCVHKNSGYSFAKGLARAKTRLAYYQEGLFVETAARIIDAMESRGVSRSALARKLKVSPSYITKILRGHENMGLETMAKLAFALDLKWECILIPKQAKVGLVSLSYGEGVPEIRAVETTTVEGLGRAAKPHEDDQYTKGAHYELPLSA